jgi:hypothetical protein
MKKITISIALFLLTTIILSQNIVDKQWGFKLDVPSSWSQKDYMDGPDKVYDFYSADQNAGFSIRIFTITSPITYEILIPVFEQNIFPSATRLALKDLTSKNGIPGKQAMYSMDNNGNKIDIAVFYTLQNSKGYVFSALVVSDIAENYKNDILSTTASFTIDGVGKNPYAVRDERPSGLGTIIGAASSSNSSAFKLVNITLTDQIDANDNVLNPTNKFSTKTEEIFAVIKSQGSTNDLIISWVYDNSNRTFNTDTYIFSGNGVGIVSMTKPNNDWPVGNYTIKFENEKKLLKEISFSVDEKTQGIGRLVENSSISSSSSSVVKTAILTHNGFDFSTGQAAHGDGETIGWNSGQQTNPNYSNGVWWRGKNTNNQIDLGNISLTSVIELPSSGWDKVINPLIKDHVYIIKCEDGYAVFKVLKQPDPNSNLWEAEVKYIYSTNGNFK